ncbi:MAG TPA: M24 family metallopeptidase, partial [Blastocatellia bacterium]|nr:M24 family metallopeptidase [Blastocatellia bacterium]
MLKPILGARWHVSPLPDSLSGDTGHLKVIHYSSIWVVLLVFAVFLAIGCGMSLAININRFSLHSMYRNRLIRAYLGASQEIRHPNPFTGFDPEDNIPMHELRPELFRVNSFADPSRFLSKLVESPDPVSQYLKSQIQERLQGLDPAENFDSSLSITRFIQKLNDVVENEPIYDKPRFANVTLGKEAEALIGQNPTGNNRVVLNRLLLQNAYPHEIKDFRLHKPFHVVNMALNLVHGDKLAWQERKAESFTASPLHCGSYTIKDKEDDHYGSYRTAKEYGGKNGISLGTAVAISGAAVSPNMGYHSSAAITFLLTLFNARLGWWLGNPGKPGRKTYYRSGPFFSIRPLLAEAFGLTDDKNKYVYLSDGGHFENLAFYEMVLRRCHSIVVSDGGGAEIVPSGDLIQQALCRYSPEQIQSHVRAMKVVEAAKDAAFDLIGAEQRAGREISELDVQTFLMQQFADHGLLTDHAPIVAVNAHAGDPHYVPNAASAAPIRRGDTVLIDLWAVEPAPGSVYADIT